jgi:hypothetical protein
MPQQGLFPDPDQPVAIDDDAVVRRVLVLFWIMWGALVGSVAILVGVAYLVIQGRDAKPAPMEIVYAFGAVAVMVAVAIPIVRRRMMPPRSDDAGLVVLPGRDAETAVGRYLVVHIVSLALCECVAVMGLAITLSGHEPTYVLGFAAASLVGMILCRPSPELLRGVLRAAAQHPSARPGT